MSGDLNKRFLADHGTISGALTMATFMPWWYEAALSLNVSSSQKKSLAFCVF